MSIEIRNVSLNYGFFQALKNVSLNIPDGELVALLGPSGSGKTTLLRLIAGLETPDEGSIMFDGKDTLNHTVSERKVGFVFQHYALFKHMNIFENVAFGLRVRPKSLRPSKEEIKQRVMELLHLVQLDEHANRLPSQLSGGQRQRVALARALAVEPSILLLDEPFGALDAKVRQELRRWLRRLHQKLNITSVFVTHDQEEALEMSDKIVVMNEGAIEQIGTPEEVYNHPRNAFVYRFLGNYNLFHERIHNGNLSEPTAVQYARPHDIELIRESENNSDIESSIVHISQIGPIYRIEVERKDTTEIVEVEMSSDTFRSFAPKINDKVFLHLKTVKVYVE